MTSQPNHAMQLIAVYETGAEIWTCPICGYQFVMTWPPEYKRIILVVGDATAPHSAVKNGLEMDVIPDEPLPPEFDDIIRRLEGG